jgi:dolichol-phosphate mannosyltransferase
MSTALSIVAPFFNEEENVLEFCSRTCATADSLGLSYELILIDDGSRDNTLQVIEKASAANKNIRYISFTRNFGHQVALHAGICASNGQYLVLIDGDLQDPPERISELYKKINQGFDVVYARRSARKGESMLKKITAGVFYRLLNRITNFNIPIDTGDFRIFNRNVADELLKMQDHSKFLRGQIAWLGFKEAEIIYEREGRKKGTTGFGYPKMFRFAFDGITGFSEFPLRFASYSGVIVSLLSFIGIIYVLIAKYCLGQTITGWASLMVTILFLGGIQLLSLGIIGEYISRINNQVRNRQLYFVKKTNIN